MARGDIGQATERLDATLAPAPRAPQALVGTTRPRGRTARSRAGAAGNAVRLACAAALAAAGCGGDAALPARAPATALPLEVRADAAAHAGFPMPPAAEARAWLTRVSVAPPVRPAPPRFPDLPAPDAPPARPELPEAAPESLEVDEGLRPPVPLGTAPLRLPPPRARALRVELDVRVDETGAVSDALWAGGSDDSLAVRAAVECALAMRFLPALRGGRPVAVWCRQGFEFGPGGIAAARPGP